MSLKKLNYSIDNIYEKKYLKYKKKYINLKLNLYGGVRTNEDCLLLNRNQCYKTNGECYWDGKDCYLYKTPEERRAYQKSIKEKPAKSELTLDEKNEQCNKLDAFECKYNRSCWWNESIRKGPKCWAHLSTKQIEQYKKKAEGADAEGADAEVDKSIIEANKKNDEEIINYLIDYWVNEIKLKTIDESNRGISGKYIVDTTKNEYESYKLKFYNKNKLANIISIRLKKQDNIIYTNGYFSYVLQKLKPLIPLQIEIDEEAFRMAPRDSNISRSHFLPVPPSSFPLPLTPPPTSPLTLLQEQPDSPRVVSQFNYDIIQEPARMSTLSPTRSPTQSPSQSPTIIPSLSSQLSTQQSSDETKQAKRDVSPFKDPEPNKKYDDSFFSESPQKTKDWFGKELPNILEYSEIPIYKRNKIITLFIEKNISNRKRINELGIDILYIHKSDLLLSDSDIIKIMNQL